METTNKKKVFLRNIILVLTSTAITVVSLFCLTQLVSNLFGYKFKQTPQFVLCYGFSAFLGAIYSRINSRG